MYRSQQSHDAGGGAEHSAYLSASTITSSFSQTQFPSPLFSVDPRLSSGSQLLAPGTNQHAGATSPAREPRSVTTSDVVHPHSSISVRLTKSPPPSAAPPPTNIAPDAPRKLLERALPSRDVTADTISAAYVEFILFCNPNFPLDVDTTTLRNNFGSPPKSDNKDFQVFRLFELIRKFDAKEIKTWNQLALDLGVEAPDVAKGQSVQKVQQYSVRLKRWMRAMHIDAFFEYLLGKKHSYFTDIPSPHDPYPPGGRDGVVPEEDLAVRALDPSFRPKRGRRRNSDADHDDGADGGPVSKHSRLEPSSALPLSAHPDGYRDPWAMASAADYNSWLEKAGPRSAVATTAPSHLRWQLHGSANGPPTPHPMTAVSTSMAAHIDRAFDEEPRSAVTPSRGRKRKHGPAVSSAWPSAMAPGSRPRGRPPSGRTTQDGAFNTFPVESKLAKPVPHTSVMGPPGDVTGAPILPPPMPRQSDGPGRPGRLSLQVPPHTGGPVRLATPPPPPRVTVNGESNSSDGRSQTQTPVIDSRPTLMGSFPTRPLHNPRVPMNDREVPGFAFEALKRVLTSDLLRADVIGRGPRLTTDEAKGLANAILDRLGVPRRESDDSRDDIARLTAASWLGLGEQLNVPLGPATSSGKTVAVTRFRRDAEGYEEIVPTSIPTAPGETRDVYDLAWTVALGGCQGAFELKGLLIDGSDPHTDPLDALSMRAFELIQAYPDDRGAEDEWLHELHQKAMNVAMTDGNAAGRGGAGAGSGDDGIDWKARAMALEFSGRVVQGAMKRVKSRLIEELMGILQ